MANKLYLYVIILREINSFSAQENEIQQNLLDELELGMFTMALCDFIIMCAKI